MAPKITVWVEGRLVDTMRDDGRQMALWVPRGANMIDTEPIKVRRQVWRNGIRYVATYVDGEESMRACEEALGAILGEV